MTRRTTEIFCAELAMIVLFALVTGVSRGTFILLATCAAVVTFGVQLPPPP